MKDARIIYKLTSTGFDLQKQQVRAALRIRDCAGGAGGGHGLRVGRVGHRWLVQDERIKERMRMMVLASAMYACSTAVLRCVHTASFLKPRLCQELVRSTSHLAPACKGSPLREMTWSHPSTSSRRRVAAES